MENKIAINTKMNNDKTNNNIPNTAFDMEYSTQWKKEKEFLKSCGIGYTFVHVDQKYHIKTYKYKKTPELFRALAMFYEQNNNEKNMNKAIDMMDHAPVENRIDGHDVDITIEDIIKATTEALIKKKILAR